MQSSAAAPRAWVLHSWSSSPGDGAETAALVLATQEFFADGGAGRQPAPLARRIARGARPAVAMSLGEAGGFRKGGSVIKLEWLDQVVACSALRPSAE